MAWLNKYKPEVRAEVPELEAVFERGNEIGDLAMGLFGDFVEVTTYTDDKLDIAAMITRTQEELAKGTENICEASFSYMGNYCAVDILRKEGDGYAIYEVKSSTKTREDEDVDSPEVKAVYVADIAYQKYVLEHCGIKVTGTYLITLNKDYVRGEDLDIHELFLVTNVANLVKDEIQLVEPNLKLADKILNSNEEPEKNLAKRCRDPYGCQFWSYCTKDLPEKSVFDLYRMRFSKKLDLYGRGIVEYTDLLACGDVKNKTQIRQMEFAVEEKDTYADADNIRDFLDELYYPLYFLDFETMMPAIPLFQGTKPYQQIPFQYSLHYIEKEGGELKHREFLGVSGEDPRRAIAEALCRDIPMNVCTTAYNKSFECTRLRELAETFPDLSEHLLNIRDHIVDLLVPFRSGYYYNRAMGGSFSIKSVLPAIYPDAPELNYHNLEGVHNGGEAMNIFPKIQYMEPADREKARQNLLKYCELDTYAMVKVWQELVRVIN
ncbi:MAG: DUF2779 domain-containing protein [Lachnospiraceae bacterium]|nr:DUF2779 domain-containing protein [Lachnospiraceae bacterium]